MSFGKPKTKTFNGKEYIKSESFDVKKEAKKAAKNLRSKGEGVRARVVKENSSWVVYEKSGREFFQWL